MALEHADIIRQRYHKGLAWRKIVRDNGWVTLTQEWHLSYTSLHKIVAGTVRTKRLTPEDIERIVRRRRLARHATYWGRKHSISALKAEYRMSTDTLNKILDSEAPKATAITSFLTMRL